MKRNSKNHLSYYLIGLLTSVSPCNLPAQGEINWFIKPELILAHSFHEGLASVLFCTDAEKKKFEWGFVDSSGKLVILPEYKYASSFYSGKCIVAYEQNYIREFYYLNRFPLSKQKDDKSVSRRLSDYQNPVIGDFSDDGVAPFAIFEGGHSKLGFIDLYETVIIPPRYEALIGTEEVSFDYGVRYGGAGFDKILYSSFSEGLAPVCLNGKWGYINLKDQWAISPRFIEARPFSEGLAFVRSENGETAFIDRTGRIRIKGKFADAGNFGQGLAPVSLKEGWVYIDTTGRVSIKGNYSRAKSFSQGLAPVWDGQWGYINRTGKVIIDFVFDKAEEFSEGKACVKKDYKYGFIYHPDNVPGKTWVLSIGIGRYQDNTISPIPLSSEFAEHFASLIRDSEGRFLPDNQIIVLTNAEATREAILTKANSIFSQTMPNDLVVFYFTGHGKNEGDLLTYDYSGEKHGVIRIESDLWPLFEKCRSKRKMLVVEACRAKTDSNSPSPRDEDKTTHPPAGLVVIQSASEGEYSFYNHKLHNEIQVNGGIFSYFLIQGLSDGHLMDANADQIIDSEELFIYLASNLKKSGLPQTPRRYSATPNIEKAIPFTFYKNH